MNLVTPDVINWGFKPRLASGPHHTFKHMKSNIQLGFRHRLVFWRPFTTAFHTTTNNGTFSPTERDYRWAYWSMWGRAWSVGPNCHLTFPWSLGLTFHLHSLPYSLFFSCSFTSFYPHLPFFPFFLPHATFYSRADYFLHFHPPF